MSDFDWRDNVYRIGGRELRRAMGLTMSDYELSIAYHQERMLRTLGWIAFD